MKCLTELVKHATGTLGSCPFLCCLFRYCLFTHMKGPSTSARKSSICHFRDLTEKEMFLNYFSGFLCWHPACEERRTAGKPAIIIG